MFRAKHAHLAFEAHHRSRHERFARLDAGAVDRVARREVVGRVHYHISARDLAMERHRIQTFGDRDNVDIGIQRAQCLERGLGFGLSDRGSRVCDLAL